MANKFSIYSLSKGKPGNKFTIKQFLELTKLADKKPGGALTNKSITLDDGYVYYADSQQEISILKKLISHKCFKKIRGQVFKIPYKFSGKNKSYYPDFVLLTNTNKIVVMEVKEIADMGSKINLRKYNALKKYCLNNGYLYIMCDKNFRTYENLLESNVNSSISRIIETTINDKGRFTYDDYLMIVREKDRKQIKKINRLIGTYVISHENVKMVGDLKYKSSQFVIKLKRTISNDK